MTMVVIMVLKMLSIMTIVAPSIIEDTAELMDGILGAILVKVSLIGMSKAFPMEIIPLLCSILPVILVSSTMWMSVSVKLGSDRVLTMMNMTAEPSVR